MTVSIKVQGGSWTKKEILGHLIDSAAINHQRFVRAQFTDDLVFDGYVQDDWVKVQDYQNRDWRELVELWHGYNRHRCKDHCEYSKFNTNRKEKKTQPASDRIQDRSPA